MDVEVLVTGAAGFIGAAVVATLSAAGARVRAGVRRTPLAPGLAALPGVAPVSCALDDAPSLAAALAGAGAVVHAAYGGGPDAARDEAALLAAAAAAGVRRLVHLSSIAVYGGREGMVDEDAAGDPPFGPYERLKRDSEARIGVWCAETGASAALLRAGAVYGPGSALWVEGLLRRIRSGGWRDLGARAAGFAPMVHVDDVASAVAAALAAPLPAGAARAFNIVHPERVTWAEYASRLAAAAGAPAPRPLGDAGVHARRIVAPVAKALRRLGAPTVAALADFPSGGERSVYARRAVYPVDRAARELGWAPRVGLAAGLAALRRPDASQTSSMRP